VQISKIYNEFLFILLSRTHLQVRPVHSFLCLMACKGVPFGVSLTCSLFRSKKPPKTPILGSNRCQTHKISKLLNYENYCINSNTNLDNHKDHQLCLGGGPNAQTTNQQIQDDWQLPFWKLLKLPQLSKWWSRGVKVCNIHSTSVGKKNKNRRTFCLSDGKTTWWLAKIAKNAASCKEIRKIDWTVVPEFSP